MFLLFHCNWPMCLKNFYLSIHVFFVFLNKVLTIFRIHDYWRINTSWKEINSCVNEREEVWQSIQFPLSIIYFLISHCSFVTPKRSGCYLININFINQLDEKKTCCPRLSIEEYFQGLSNELDITLKLFSLMYNKILFEYIKDIFNIY